MSMNETNDHRICKTIDNEKNVRFRMWISKSAREKEQPKYRSEADAVVKSFEFLNEEILYAV